MERKEKRRVEERKGTKLGMKLKERWVGQERKEKKGGGENTKGRDAEEEAK